MAILVAVVKIATLAGGSAMTDPTALVEMAPRPVAVYVILGTTGVKTPRVDERPRIDPPKFVVVLAEPMLIVLLLLDPF